MLGVNIFKQKGSDFENCLEICTYFYYLYCKSFIKINTRLIWFIISSIDSFIENRAAVSKLFLTSKYIKTGVNTVNFNSSTAGAA